MKNTMTQVSEQFPSKIIFAGDACYSQYEGYADQTIQEALSFEQSPENKGFSFDVPPEYRGHICTVTISYSIRTGTNRYYSGTSPTNASKYDEKFEPIYTRHQYKIKLPIPKIPAEESLRAQVQYEDPEQATGMPTHQVKDYNFCIGFTPVSEVPVEYYKGELSGEEAFIKAPQGTLGLLNSNYIFFTSEKGQTYRHTSPDIKLESDENCQTLILTDPKTPFQQDDISEKTIEENPEIPLLDLTNPENMEQAWKKKDRDAFPMDLFIQNAERIRAILEKAPVIQKRIFLVPAHPTTSLQNGFNTDIVTYKNRSQELVTSLTVNVPERFSGSACLIKETRTGRIRKQLRIPFNPCGYHKEKYEFKKVYPDSDLSIEFPINPPTKFFQTTDPNTWIEIFPPDKLILTHLYPEGPRLEKGARGKDQAPEGANILHATDFKAITAAWHAEKNPNTIAQYQEVLSNPEATSPLEKETALRVLSLLEQVPCHAT
mgnify:CR=1 FL=1